MLFGQKSEKGKCICDGQMLLDGCIINEAKAESNPAAPEPTVESVAKKSKKKGQMWIVCTGAAASRKIALYTYRDSRSKTVAEELPSGYTGVVQTDGLQSYGSGDYAHAVELLSAGILQANIQ